MESLHPNPNRQTLSVVIPVYNEESSLPFLADRLENALGGLQDIDYEVILVDDHSSDRTPELLAEICRTRGNGQFKTLRLSSNCGSHIAVIAGMAHATGNCAVFMAADLQDPPELVPELVEKWREGYSVVWAVRQKREGVSRKSLFFSNLFYKLFNNLANVKFPPAGADYAVLDRKVYTALVRSAGSKPSLGALICWLGFKSTEIQYVKAARQFGKSKWTLTKKLNAMSDAFVGFSYKPLRLMSYIGFGAAALGFLYALVVVALRLLWSVPVPSGWASLMVVVTIIGGLQMMMLGVLGEYLWRTLEEARRRPLFVVEASVNLEEVPAPALQIQS